ncbi:MAG TPA: extracellular solute-binding protein [Stenomitos sp.]
MSKPVKRFLAVPLLGLMVSLSGCDRPSNQSTVTLWHPWGGAELSALKEAIAQYQTSHPGTEVVALQVPSDKLQDKYLRSTAANGGPDLVVGFTDWVGKFAQSEVIAPLDGQVPKALSDRYVPVALSALRYQGKLYALPESMETLALYYNKDLVHGKPPETLEELFIQANSRDYWSGDYYLAYNTQFFFTAGYLFGMGGTLLQPDGTVRLDTPGAQNWMKLIKDLKTHPYIAAKSDYGRADSLFRDGKAAMTINGPWALGDYQKVFGDKLGVATLPMVEDKVPAVPFVGVKCLMFNPNSTPPARARAMEFASFMASPEVVSRFEREAGHIPAVRDVQIPDGDKLQAFAEQARWGTPMPPNPEMKEVWAPMDQAIEKVMTDSAPAAQAISEAQRVISAKIEAVRNQ